MQASQPQNMLDVVVKNDRKNLIIFIHGFKGGRRTWVREDKKKSILNYFEEDNDIINHYDLAVFDYYSRITDLFGKLALIKQIFGINKISRKNLTIKSIGNLLKSEIDFNCKQYEKIVLVAHSMGGLVAKSYIIEELTANKGIKTGLYISLAVPHSGSDLATFGSIIVNHPQVGDLRPLSDQIHSMHQAWVKEKDQLPITYYFQAKDDRVVPENSSVAIDGRELDIVYSQDDHFSIITPRTANSVVISAIKQACKGYLISKKVVKITVEEPTKITGGFQSKIIEKHQKEEVGKYNESFKAGLLKDLRNVNFFYRQIKSETSETYTFEDFVTELKTSQFSVIYGMGGLGKSLLLKRIMNKIANDTPLSFNIFCDAKSWQENYSTGLKKDMPLDQRINNLLSGFQINLTTDDLKNNFGALKENDEIKKFIFLDGLNEIGNMKTRKEITDAIFDLCKNLGFSACMLSRYKNQNDYKSWKFYELEKIDATTLEKITVSQFGKKITKYSDQNLDYLSIPYFLDLAIQSNKDIINGYSDYLYDHVLKNVKSSEKKEAIKILSGLAYKAYLSDHTFIIPKDNVTPTFKKKYVESKILNETEKGFEFEHHLIIELFVAHKISQNDELWNRQTFDKITLENRISFEVLQMILEQIEGDESGEKFLTVLYDWNFYAALHCIRSVNKNYSRPFAVLLTLILTEKLFDRFKHTKMKVKDYLKPLYKKFDVKNIPENIDEFVSQNPTIENNKDAFYNIINSNAIYFSEGKYMQAYLILAYNENTLNDVIISRIVDTNPLIGWSTSNVLKRVKYSAENEFGLRLLYLTNSDFIYKWRIVHALGNASNQATIELLINILKKDEYIWVTYGTIRSLFEIALFISSKEEAEGLMNEIFTVLISKTYTKACLNEVKSCLETDISIEKNGVAVNMVKKIISSDYKNFEEKEVWRNLLNKLTGYHETQN